MRHLLCTSLIPLAITVGLTAQTAGTPNPHEQMNARGAHAMGFDQEETFHHFLLYEDGGAIQITVKERRDKANLDAIRGHLPHLIQMFAAGNFSIPGFIHAQNPPGADRMARLKDRISYAYEEIRDGGRVRITTRHASALQAIHEFLRFQITEHNTGDSLEVMRVPGEYE